MGDSMATCPECGDTLNYSARRCSCGWVAKAPIGQPAIDMDSVRAEAMAISMERACAWLVKHGLMRRQDESRESYMQRLSDARNKLRRTPRPHPRDWAKVIMQDHDDGLMVPELSLRLARETVEAHQWDAGD